MKKPERVPSNEMIQGEVPQKIEAQVELIRVKDEEIPDAELWNTESLCFTYYNILHQYKTTKQVSLSCPLLPLNY